MSKDKFHFDEILKELKSATREVLVVLSNQAQNYFLESFTKQGFNGNDWKEVQRRTPGTNAYKYPKTKGLQRRTSPILVGAGYKIRGGTLRRTVSVMARTAEISGTKLRMVVDLPYAKIQNETRQFVGQTKELSRIQKEEIDRIIFGLLKK